MQLLSGTKNMLRLLPVAGLSVLMLCGLALYNAPSAAHALRPGANPPERVDTTEPFAPTGRFVAVFTPTNEWNEEIPLVASPVLDNQGVIFASLQETGINQNKILRSTDGGKHWETIQVPAMFYHAELALSPNFVQDRTVLGGFGSGLYRSTDGGSQWTYVSNPPVTSIHLLRVSPDYPNDHTLFVGNYGGGVYQSTDDGLSWSRLFTDTAAYVTDLEVSPGYPTDPTVFVSIYNDGIFRSDNGGITATHLTAPQYSPDFRITLSPEFDTDDTLFVVANGISNGGAFRSNTRGDGWIGIKSGFYTNLIVVSPNFAQDRTVIVSANDNQPPSISEDAGDTWYPMSGLYGLSGIRTNRGLVLAYEHGILLPVFSTNQTIFRYRWPSLGLSTLSVWSKPGDTEPVTLTVPLNPDEPAPTHWAASENADWLLAAPLSGTLPATLTLIADVAQLTATTWTPLRLDTQWSLRQTETITVPVGVMVVRSQTYLPLITKPRPGIHGRVTENGVPAAGVPVELQFYNGSTWSSPALILTQTDGWYAFTNVPGLASGQRYDVRYLNNGAGRLWMWHTRMLDTYTTGSSVHIGDFDIADIALLAPPNNIATSLPRTFSWAVRPATPSDSYEFNLYDPQSGDPYFRTDPRLGYSGSFTLTTLPAAFNLGQPYAWEVWVYSPDGGLGISWLPRMISFTNRGAVFQPPVAVNQAPLAAGPFADPLLNIVRRQR